MKRLLASLVFCCLFVFLIHTICTPAFAQTTTTPLNSYIQADTNPDVPQNMHSLTQIVTTEVLSAMICQLAGIDVLNHNQSCLGVDPNTHHIGYVKSGGGVVGMLAGGILFTYNIPVHFSDYTHYLANNFGTPKAYAATQTTGTGGVGFIGLEPLIGLWTTFRNIVYLFFVIIFVLVGVAIMLRVQIDPRTVMTLENQLPKIIIGLVLVTLSYAIAGFLVDAMWLVTFLIINVIASTDPNATMPNGQTLTNSATVNLLQGPLGYINNIFTTHNAAGLLGSGEGVLDIAGSAARAIQQMTMNVFTNTGMAKIGLPDTQPNLATAIANAIGTVLGYILGAIISNIIGLLGFLVVIVALLLTMFRVWFMLLQAYAYIILDVILAPFYIAAGLIPGSSIGFGSWIRSLVSNLLAFPVTVFMFVVARVLLDVFTPGGIPNAIANVGGGSLFEPPLIGAAQGTGADNVLGVFVSLALIFATPVVLDTVRKALQVQPSPFGAAAMASVGAGGKALSGTVRRAANLRTAYAIDPLHATAMQRVWSSIFR